VLKHIFFWIGCVGVRNSAIMLTQTKLNVMINSNFFPPLFCVLHSSFYSLQFFVFYVSSCLIISHIINGNHCGTFYLTLPVYCYYFVLLFSKKRNGFWDFSFSSTLCFKVKWKLPGSHLSGFCFENKIIERIWQRKERQVPSLGSREKIRNTREWFT
jgi:hypothetical protein